MLLGANARPQYMKFFAYCQYFVQYLQILCNTSYLPPRLVELIVVRNLYFVLGMQNIHVAQVCNMDAQVCHEVCERGIRQIRG